MDELASLPIGAKVQHAELGEGLVIFAKTGFTSVKVRFGARERKVSRAELRLLSLPNAVASHMIVLRVLELVDIWGWHPPGKRPKPGPWRSGQGYDDAEIELMYRVKNLPHNKAALARLLLRTEDAIAFVWRWCDHAGFGPRADDAIKRQVKALEARVGRTARGSWEAIPNELLRRISP